MNQLENTLTSLEVAEMVSKNHADVMRDIRRIIEHLGQSKIAESSNLADHKSVASYSTEEIAAELGIFSESKKPHSTAVSQFIKTYLTLEDDEFELFAESSGNWSGSVTKYAESVLEKVEQTIKEMGYPMFVPSKNGKNYHIYYRNIA